MLAGTPEKLLSLLVPRLQIFKVEVIIETFLCEKLKKKKIGGNALSVWLIMMHSPGVQQNFTAGLLSSTWLSFAFCCCFPNTHYLLLLLLRWWVLHPGVCVCVLVAQLCLTLCNAMNGSPPGFSVHGILQARILEWIATPFSRGSS